MSKKERRCFTSVLLVNVCVTCCGARELERRCCCSPGPCPCPQSWTSSSSCWSFSAERTAENPTAQSKPVVGAAREQTAGEKSNLALGEAPDEGAAGPLVAAGIRLVRRVRSVLTFPLRTSRNIEMFNTEIYPQTGGKEFKKFLPWSCFCHRLCQQGAAQ